MILKKFSQKLIKLYQYYISPMFGQKCRYYPTCSEYAMWEFRHDGFLRAAVKSFFRILRCNQLFKGGIDYPVVKKKITASYGKKTEIEFWFIPAGKNKYFVIKANNE